jgi:hypothetical protein
MVKHCTKSQCYQHLKYEGNIIYVVEHDDAFLIRKIA